MHVPSCARPFALILLAGAALSGCQPTVKVEAPDKPIVINLNVKIEQEVKIKIDRELDDAFSENPSLFQ
ncbi:MAG TPA: YnbE family lipoprotein [Alphaproteobacteria bacterium]